MVSFWTHNNCDTKYVGFPQPAILSCLGDSDSSLTLTAWSQQRPCRSRSVPRDSPHFRCQLQAPGCHPYLWQTGHKSGVLTSPSSGSRICWASCQNTGKCFTCYSSFIIKDVTQEQPNRRDASDKVCGKGLEHAPFLCAPPSQLLQVFTSPEVLQTP